MSRINSLDDFCDGTVDVTILCQQNMPRSRSLQGLNCLLGSCICGSLDFAARSTGRSTVFFLRVASPNLLTVCLTEILTIGRTSPARQEHEAMHIAAAVHVSTMRDQIHFHTAGRRLVPVGKGSHRDAAELPRTRHITALAAAGRSLQHASRVPWPKSPHRTLGGRAHPDLATGYSTAASIASRKSDQCVRY